MKNLPAIWDGTSGPVLRFLLKDGGTVKDTSSVAVELKIRDATSGSTICTRPGVLVSPKSGGYVDVWLKGSEVDWAGLGRELLIVPKLYFATTAAGAAATNLLVNPSFDTGTTVATSWTQGGTLGTMTYEVVSDDPAPPVIFGKAQRSFETVGGSSSAYLTQAPSQALAAGDSLSAGVWYRANLTTGAAMAGSSHYIRVNDGRTEAASTLFPTTDSDWTFVTVTSSVATTYATATVHLVNFDAEGYEVRYDDAFLFVGTWRVVHADPLRLQVRPRAVVAKSLTGSSYSQIAGRGGFEYDSNADGVADGWLKTGSTNTYAHEVDPDNLDTSSLGAQKVTLAGATADRLRIICRGDFDSGQEWAFRVQYKNGGALTGSPSAGDFAVVISTEEFDGPAESGTTDIGTGSVSAYATKQASMTLANDHNSLVCDINLNGVTGTAWFDSALLWRVS